MGPFLSEVNNLQFELKYQNVAQITFWIIKQAHFCQPQGGGPPSHSKTGTKVAILRIFIYF